MHFQTTVWLWQHQHRRRRNDLGQLHFCRALSMPPRKTEARQQTFCPKGCSVICIAVLRTIRKGKFWLSKQLKQWAHTHTKSKARINGGMRKAIICNRLQMHTTTNDLVAIWQFCTTSISYQQASLIYSLLLLDSKESNIWCIVHEQ